MFRAQNEDVVEIRQNDDVWMTALHVHRRFPRRKVPAPRGLLGGRLPPKTAMSPEDNGKTRELKRPYIWRKCGISDGKLSERRLRIASRLIE